MYTYINKLYKAIMIEFSTRALNIQALARMGKVVKGDPFTRRLASGKTIKVQGRYRKALRKQLVEEKAKQIIAKSGEIKLPNFEIASPLGRGKTIKAESPLYQDTKIISTNYNPYGSTKKGWVYRDADFPEVKIKPRVSTPTAPEILINRNNLYGSLYSGNYLSYHFDPRGSNKGTTMSRRFRRNFLNKNPLYYESGVIYPSRQKASLYDPSREFLGSKAQKAARTRAISKARKANQGTNNKGRVFTASDFFEPRTRYGQTFYEGKD